MSSYEVPKTDTHRLTKKIQENNGVAANRSFQNEDSFQKWLKNWLEGKELIRKGWKTDQKNKPKKERAEITKVTREINRESGFGDIAIHHDFLDLSWNHALSSPFVIECKMSNSFRKGVEQAIRYKDNSDSKYQTKQGYKLYDTGVVTPKSLKTGEVASRHGTDNPYPVNFESKRIYWNLGVGVIQSINPYEIVISFCEQDMVVIR